MSDPVKLDERLRRRFLDDPEDDGAGSGIDGQAVWAASGGELDAEATRRLIDLAARSTEAADAWRVALALRREAVAGPMRARRRWSPWLAVAASVALLVLAGVVIRQRLPEGERPATLREAAAYRVESLVPPGASLPREAFRLVWSPGPAGSFYTVEVAGEDLQLLHSRASLAEPEYVVPAEALRELERGATVLWRVEAFLADGRRVASATFRAEIDD